MPFAVSHSEHILLDKWINSAVNYNDGEQSGILKASKEKNLA